MFFKIDNLRAGINSKSILHNFSLDINKGEIHTIMGPNGSGKSTLSRVIMGDPGYSVFGGNIYFMNKKINKLRTDERARLGIFLSMQSPTSVEVVSNIEFLRTIVKDKNIDLYDFMNKIETLTINLKMNKDMIHRSLNQGFSGGERKKNEILQMLLLKPKMIILDEIDSGLDIDSLKVVCNNIINYKKENKDVSILIITHYPKILGLIKPDYVHIMTCGKIVKTGDYKLALEIENSGYNQTTKGNKDNE